MHNDAWQHDWSTFVECVAADLGGGLSSVEVSKIYGNRRVTWSGKVAKPELDDLDNPGVRMEMSPTHIRLPDGRYTIANYLYLNISQKDVGLWREVPQGTLVRFEAELQEGNGPFPGIRWANLGGKEGYISIAAVEATLVGASKRASE